MSAEKSSSFEGNERFGILRSIGAGGMGVVYEAYDRERQSLVALKTLRQASPETIFQFKQEFRSISQVVHPNLVPLYELISDGEQWFFTMELLADAVDLRSYLRSESVEEPGDSGSAESSSEASGEDSFTEAETVDASVADLELLEAEAAALQEGAGDSLQPATRDLDWSRVRETFQQLAEGVVVLHEAGILHRDLKPENVLIRQDGRVVLLDFGLVLELDADQGLTSGHAISGEGGSSSGSRHDATSDHIAGSVGYMAPEQAAAQALTRASDWYAMGVMLYEILTGRLPIKGKPLEILRDKQRLDPPSPRSVAPEVPEDLDALCMNLLQRDADKRPQGAEVIARLRGATTTDEAVPTEAAPVLATPFVGREEHLEVLSRCFENTSNGEVGVCRIHGQSGAGKSALVEHFLLGLSDREEPVILSGRCYEQESVPYKAVDSLLDALTRYFLRLPEEEVERLIPDQVGALARVFPVLKRIPAIASVSSGQAGGGDLNELRSQAFDSLRDLLGRIGERHPLVLYIDDLQWGDLDSAALLKDILCSAAPPRVLMILCYRTEYVGVSPCLQAMDSLADDAETPVFEELLEVDALTAEETRDLAMTLVGEETEGAASQVDWVVAESGGSAMFIYELVQHLKAGMERFEAGETHLDEILWRRIRRLPEESMRLLEVIAVASRPLPLRQAQTAAGFQTLPPEAVGALRSQRLVRTTGPGLDDEIECYHDRIRESTVAHLPERTIKGHHASLAGALEKDGDLSPELLAGHLEGAGELERAGELYREAAGQALEALAFDQAEDFYQRALTYATDDAARAEILERQVHFYTDLARFEDAYRVGREGAALFGIKLPPKFHPPSFVVDLVGAKLRLGRRPVASLLDLPTMTDERLRGAVRMIAAVAKAAYQVRPELCVAVNARMVNLCLKNGNTSDNAIGYMVFGAIFLGGILGNYRRGYEFGRLSLDLIEKYDNVQQKAEVNFVVGYFGTSWLRPATEAERLWQIAHESGLETGDLFHMGCASCATMLSYYMRGVSLDRLLEESEGHLQLLERVGLREPAGAVKAVRQAVLNLRGETRKHDSFSDDDFDETTYVESLATYGSRHFAHYYYVVKMQAAYLWGDLETALETVDAAKGYLKESAGMLHSAEHRFYQALILAALRTSSGTSRPGAELRTIRKNQGLLRKWAARCPQNFLHKERLVAAELARINGDQARAGRLYEEAGAAAAEHGYLQIEALAHQLAARASEDGEKTTATSHREAACERYRLWGATAYAQALADGGLDAGR